jgi:hypothetical protein
VNQAPTVAAAASASPNPVTGTTTALSVLGADDGGETALTYTWATTGTPPAAVDFSANGTNAAKSSTATFSKVGTYRMQCTIKDAGNLTAISQVTVTVNQTVARVTVTPASATLKRNQIQQFTATVHDQFGMALAIPPTVTWSPATLVCGTLSSTGLFTANNTLGGPCILTATSAGKSGTATVTVARKPPTVVVSATATPSPDRRSVILSTLGADDEGRDSSLIYTWSVDVAAPAPVAYSINGTNASKTTTAACGVAGAYTFTVVIMDADGLSAISSVSVAVPDSAFSGGGEGGGDGGSGGCGLGSSLAALLALALMSLMRLRHGR